MIPLSRREFFRLTGAAALASALPGCEGPRPLSFFSDDERATLGALADAVLPPDDQPGGRALGTVPYVELLLTSFERTPLAILAGGPYSGRAPLPDGKGGASSTFPPNDFANFLPLDRVQLASWRFQLYGSSGLQQLGTSGPNDAIARPTDDSTAGVRIGLRDRVKQGLAAARKLAPDGKSLADLDAVGLASVFQNLDRDFRDLLVELVSEAAFAAPEYGGNPGLAGWKMVHFEGDQMPLGFSLWDDTAKVYRERLDLPMSTANPGPDPEPVDDASHKFVATVVKALGGKVFY